MLKFSRNSRPDLLRKNDLVTNLEQRMETKNGMQQLCNKAKTRNIQTLEKNWSCSANYYSLQFSFHVIHVSSDSQMAFLPTEE